MRSSPAFATLDLELPPVTVAARLAGILVLLAAAFVAWSLLVRGHRGPAALVVAAIALGYVLQFVRQRTVRRDPMRLRLDVGGTMTLQTGNAPPAAVRLGPGTRRLGPSVFLDLRVTTAAGCRRVGRWLTPFDVAAADLRRWTVALPLCRGVAGR